MVKGFSKMYNLSFYGQIFFANIFTIKLDFAIKNSIFANLQIFFADYKSRAQELSNDVSFVIFGHKTWYPGFQVPQRDRVKTKE